MDGGEAVGNGLGRAPLGRSEMEATTGWTEGKPWEIAWRVKASVCKAPLFVNVFCV